MNGQWGLEKIPMDPSGGLCNGPVERCLCLGLNGWEQNSRWADPDVSCDCHLSVAHPVTVVAAVLGTSRWVLWGHQQEGTSQRDS